MTLLIPTVLAAALMAAPAPEQKPKAPEGPAPEFATVTDTDQKEGTCTLCQIRNVPVEVEETIHRSVNGMDVVEKVLVTTYVPVTRVIRIKVVGSQITDGEGKAVPEEDAWKRLTPNTTIVLSRNGATVDPAYLRLLKKETIVIAPGGPGLKPPTDGKIPDE